jgi:hypothetical protein
MAEAPYQPRRASAVDPDGADPDAAGLEGETATPVPALSWAEQEVLTALKRLARAQSQLQAPKGQRGPAARSLDPIDAERLESLAAELTQARSKASGRFAKGAARDRVRELELSERLLLERLGVSSLAEFRALVDAAPPTVEPVDPAVLAFARQELASAQQGWLDVQALEMPPEPDPPAPAASAATDRPAPDVA